MTTLRKIHSKLEWCFSNVYIPTYYTCLDTHVLQLQAYSITYVVSGKLANILGRKIMNSEVKRNQEETVTMITMEEQNRRLALQISWKTSSL
jgi:hypothetical protein